MLELVTSGKYNKDLKNCVKQGKDIGEIKVVVDILRIPAPLPEKYLDHPLHGKLKDFRECHIAPDWLLIYRQDKDALYLYRTGSHSDLFKE